MKIKKIISLLIVAAVTISIFSISVLADTTGNSGNFTIENGTLTAYNGSGGDVTIPSSVSSIGDNAFAYCIDLTSVTIPSSITSIGTNVFSNCNENLIIYGSKGSLVQTYAKDNNINFSLICPSFGAVKYSTTTLTNKNVTVTIPVINATVSSVSHTFTSNSSYTFTLADKDGNKATKTVKVSNIDKTKPTIKLSIGNVKSTNGKVTITISDTNLKSESVKLNGKSLLWPKNNTFTSKGSYVITSTDKAGNTSAVSFSIVKKQ